MLLLTLFLLLLAFKYGEAGYWSMLSTGSNVSKDDMRNKDYAAVVKSICKCCCSCSCRCCCCSCRCCCCSC